MAVPTKALCTAPDHSGPGMPALASPAATEQCARIFRALGEPSRLRLLARLMAGPACVGELAAAEGEPMTSISQRLRVLRTENIVTRRRSGKHLQYSLADEHMLALIRNGLDHASEREAHTPSHLHLKGDPMQNEHRIHDNHPHQHGPNCGHTAIEHDGHTDYLHQGHLHHPHDGHVDEHTLEVSAANPADCTNGHSCQGHDAAHTHGPDCGHPVVPHADHVDYLVDGHLHHPHEGHCDNHGNVAVVQ